MMTAATVPAASTTFTARRIKVAVGESTSFYEGVEVDMPFGTLLLTDGRPCAFLPRGKGKARVDGVQHHVKYGFQRGVGAMWLRKQTGKAGKVYTRECALALVGYALVGGWDEAFTAAGEAGRAALSARIHAAYAAVEAAAAATA